MDREVFRLVPPLILWWVWLAFAVANVADFAIEGASARFATVVSVILLVITGLAYALALRPRVIAEPSGLTIANPFRDHHVPWAAIQAVDTGDWVRVNYAPDGPSPGPRSSADSKAIWCWALYISARAKRRSSGTYASTWGYAAAGPPRSARTFMPSLFGNPSQQPGYAQSSRLPEEARYLASLPTAKAIAVRLETRAARERARAGHPEHPDRAGPKNPVTTRWAWPAVAAVALPALALLIIALA